MRIRPPPGLTQQNEVPRHHTASLACIASRGRHHIVRRRFDSLLDFERPCRGLRITILVESGVVFYYFFFSIIEKY